MALSVHIKKKLKDFELAVDFDMDEGIVGFLGSSGCGKSMTLKCIAGIETPDEGRIVLDDEVLFDKKSGINLSPQKRKVGYLFQNYALFPHMTVKQNIEAGLAASGKSKQEKKRNSGTSLRTVPHKRIGELLPSPYFRRTAAKSRPCPNDGSRAKVFIVR